jgi:hypothetical protein
MLTGCQARSMRGTQDACEQRDLRWVLSNHCLLPCIASGVGGGRNIGRGISTRARLTECVVNISSTAGARAPYTPRARPAVQGTVSRAEAEGGARHTLYTVRSDARTRRPSARRSPFPPSHFTTPTRSSTLSVPVAATPPAPPAATWPSDFARNVALRGAYGTKRARVLAHMRTWMMADRQRRQAAQVSSDDRAQSSRRRDG